MVVLLLYCRTDNFKSVHVIALKKSLDTCITEENDIFVVKSLGIMKKMSNLIKEISESMEYNTSPNK